MPPAFVLSQDQTLRKIKLFYRKIRFKAFKILRLEINFVSCEFSRFTSHYSIFNQLTHQRRVTETEYITLFQLCKSFFEFFSIFSNRKLIRDDPQKVFCVYQPRCVCPVQDAQQKHNISHFFNFANRFSKFFRFF